MRLRGQRQSKTLCLQAFKRNSRGGGLPLVRQMGAGAGAHLRSWRAPPAQSPWCARTPHSSQEMRRSLCGDSNPAASEREPLVCRPDRRRMYQRLPEGHQEQRMERKPAILKAHDRRHASHRETPAPVPPPCPRQLTPPPTPRDQERFLPGVPARRRPGDGSPAGCGLPRFRRCPP